jgi:hypothetical protein
LRWERLDPGEQDELVALARKAGRGDEGPRIDLGQLSAKEAGRWEGLVEQATDQRGAFENLRLDHELRATAARARQEASKAPARPRFEERGAVVLPREVVFEWADRPQPILWVIHYGILVFLLGQLESGKALVPHGRVEGEGDESVLVIRRDLGLGAKYDPDSMLRGWEAAVRHLAQAELLTLDQQGTELRVGRGPRILDVMRGRQS